MKIEIHKLQIARRTVQIGVVLLMLAIPAVSRYANYLSALEADKHIERWEGTMQGATLQLIDSTFRALPGGEKERVGEMVRDREQVLLYTQGFRGSPWSMKLGPVSMSDPLAAAESIARRKRVVGVLMISLLVPIIVTLLFGRVFCSWICPMGLLMELSDKLRRVLGFLEIHPGNLRFPRWTKFTLLAAGLICATIFSVPVLGYIYPPTIIGREAHDFVFGIFDRAEEGMFGFWAGGLTWMSLIIVGIALFEVAVSRRWWCRYVCPGGALYSLLGAARPIRVKLRASKCTSCGDCVVACPVGLNPMRDKMGIECDNCGVCISHCNDNALAYGLWPAPKEAHMPIPDTGTLLVK